jgi:hypothetical protein
MDLGRMLEKCRRDQWSVDQLDWTQPPRTLSKEDEIAVVQYFTNMAGIEKLAAALFREQGLKTKDPTLKAIFESFVVDEERHSDAAIRLARHYDVHHYRVYETNPALVRFTPHFVNAIRFLSAEVANTYITTGELVLDVALLRSLDDFVNDGMSRAAMELINRDESRHIAIDFFMTEYYASDAYQRDSAHEPAQPLATRLRAWWALLMVFYFAGPFFREVFFRPMDLIDPTGRRLLEAFKRIQLVAAKPEIARRPFNRFLSFLQAVHMNRFTGPILSKVAARVVGLEPRVMDRLYTDEEKREAERMSIEELAERALQAKYAF